MGRGSNVATDAHKRHALVVQREKHTACLLLVSGAVIVGREITMSALRELAAARGGAAYKAVAVSTWGKWKTAAQVRCRHKHVLPNECTRYAVTAEVMSVP